VWRPWQRAANDRTGQKTAAIEQILPHLDAAYNLARWLMRDPVRAEDVVQDSVVRALAGQQGFRGGDAKAWLLRIVRNTAYDALSATKRRSEDGLEDDVPDNRPDAETIATHREALSQAAMMLETLPLEWREALVLRELEGLSYREIAGITDVPIGTVMSRLSRARQAMLDARASQRKDRP
jgi:RNA polymerase sigma-70 factor (ECF subfamily)